MGAGLQPRWLLVATLAAIVVGIAIAVWLYGSLAAG
jgi:hypothetical protein